MKDGLNDLYVRDKMERNTVDYYGSGIESGHYNRNIVSRENLHESAIYIMLVVVLSLIWIGLSVLTIKEINLRVNGNLIQADNTPAYNMATVVVDGKQYSFNTNMAFTNSKTVNVYYYGDDIASGQVLTPVYVYLLSHALLLGLLVFFLRKIFHNMHKTHHSEGAVDHHKFDE